MGRWFLLFILFIEIIKITSYPLCISPSETFYIPLFLSFFINCCYIHIYLYVCIIIICNTHITGKHRILKVSLLLADYLRGVYLLKLIRTNATLCCDGVLLPTALSYRWTFSFTLLARLRFPSTTHRVQVFVCCLFSFLLFLVKMSLNYLLEP